VDLHAPGRTRAPNGWNLHQSPIDEACVVVATGPLRHTDALTTVIDLAGILDDVRFEWVLESALRQRLIRLDQLSKADAGRGQRRLDRVLALRPPGARPTGSIRETQFVQLLRRVDVPPPERQVPVEVGGRVVAVLDLAWPELGVFIEIDGHWHDADNVAVYDRHRQNDVVTALGWRPLRYDSDDILRRPTHTARTVEAAYQRLREGSQGSQGETADTTPADGGGAHEGAQLAEACGHHPRAG
jgi:very-short-patch-repair endonuclease